MVIHPFIGGLLNNVSRVFDCPSVQVLFEWLSALSALRVLAFPLSVP